ncbi:MAG: HD domain-containing protein [Deltaproteobacteria bacterium]|nr:MAG: HD domain-containing protein [Deltaproteobacteria bacterium]
MTRFEAYLLLRRRLRDKSRVRRSLAVEAAMEDLAERLGREPERWALAGLLHDIDWEFVRTNPTRQGKVAAEMLAAEGLEADICSAVEEFRRPGKPGSQLAAALAASAAAVDVLMELAAVQDDWGLLSAESLYRACTDQSVAPDVDRRPFGYLEDFGLSEPELVESVRRSLLRVASDVFRGSGGG